MKEIIIVGFSNKVNNYKEKSISSKNRQVRNNLKSVVYWKELKENIISMFHKELMNKVNLNYKY